MTNSVLPIATGAQMAAVDRAMVDVCGLELMQIMETAGRAVAMVTRSRWRALETDRPVVILCGSGGNGGDGFVAARYLAGWGIPIELWLMRPSVEMRGLAAHQLDVCHRLELPIIEPDRSADVAHAALIVDGLFGFGLSAAPTGRAAELISAATAAAAPILAIDIASGLDATTGVAYRPAIRADLTVTLGLPKSGLLLADGPACSGTVIVADIGIPAAAYAATDIPETVVFRDAEFVDLSGVPVEIR